jgi:hypothetical protein
MPLFQRLQGAELTMDMKSQKSEFVIPAYAGMTRKWDSSAGRLI